MPTASGRCSMFNQDYGVTGEQASMGLVARMGKPSQCARIRVDIRALVAAVGNEVTGVEV